MASGHTTSSQSQTSGFGAPGDGRLRRLISLDRRGDGCAVAWLEDDFHHFGVTIIHNDARVTDVRVVALRYPWSSCVGSPAALQALVGKPLVERSSAIGGLIEMRSQCTHIFDLSGLLLRHISLRRQSRIYEVTVPDHCVTRPGPDDGAEPLEPVMLRQDGRLVMEWHVRRGAEIAGPGPFAGHSLGRGFRQWTEAMDGDQAEHAGILRRAVLVAGGRQSGISDTNKPAGMPTLCYGLRPEKWPEARQLRHLKRRFDDSPDGMLLKRGETP